MTQDEVVQLIIAKANEYGLVPVEFLGGAIAESALRVDAARYGVWPDVSFGLFQQTVAYADEGDHSNSPANIAYIKSLYEDPVHACDVAAIKFKYWRYNPEVPALTAWCAYNWPVTYHNPESNPNVSNYRDGLSRAASMLQVPVLDAPESGQRLYGPDVPDSVVLQQNNWSCAVRSTYAALWSMSSHSGIPAVTYGDGGPRDVYDLLVPKYDDPSVGLHRADGQGLVEALAKWGYTAHAKTDAPLLDVQSLAGTKPLLLGGIAWNHWVYCRGVESDGTLVIENPSPGFGGIYDQLRDSWTRLGPFTMVEIDVPQPNPVSPDGPQYRYGIASKATLLGDAIVGTPLEDEHYIEGFSLQRTTKGLFVYSVASNVVTFIPA